MPRANSADAMAVSASICAISASLTTSSASLASVSASSTMLSTSPRVGVLSVRKMKTVPSRSTLVTFLPSSWRKTLMVLPSRLTVSALLSATVSSCATTAGTTVAVSGRTIIAVAIMPILPKKRLFVLAFFILSRRNRSIMVFGEFSAVAKAGTPSNAVRANTCPYMTRSCVSFPAKTRASHAASWSIRKAFQLIHATGLNHERHNKINAAKLANRSPER